MQYGHARIVVTMFLRIRITRTHVSLSIYLNTKRSLQPGNFVFGRLHNFELQVEKQQERKQCQQSHDVDPQAFDWRRLLEHLTHSPARLRVLVVRDHHRFVIAMQQHIQEDFSIELELSIRN